MSKTVFKPTSFPFVSLVLMIFWTLFSGGLHAQQRKAASIWIGTAGNSIEMDEGIYRSLLSSNEQSLSRVELVHKLKGAGWVATSPSSMMYATGNIDGKPVVVSFDSADDDAPLQHQEIGDGGSCFVTTDRSGKILISAQYGGGSIAVFPINEKGRLGPRSQLFDHSGGSRVVGRRQDSPHPHYVAISPDNQFAFVPDLGLDQLVRYRIDAARQELEPAGAVDVIPGGGPRHMKFDPQGKYAFVLNELSLSVTVFKYGSESGQMTKLKTVPTLTVDEKNQNSFNSASEIRVHPNGRVVITANRGHDSMSVFRFDPDTADLKRVQVEPVRGSWPRNFNFSPSGDSLIVAGKDSNSLTMFSVNTENANIRYRQHQSVLVPAPICITNSN